MLSHLATFSQSGALSGELRKSASISVRILMSASVSSRGHRLPDAPAPLAPKSACMSSSWSLTATPAPEPPAANSSKLALDPAGCNCIVGRAGMAAVTDTASPVGVGENGAVPVPVPAVSGAMYGDPAPPWWCSMAAATFGSLHKTRNSVDPPARKT
uniref:Uncharacterized protein n=1 Tax=Zea mays TaxID=4577 RepID=C4JBL1_MAIZE|nr:unknown [Zea mays]